MSDPNGAGGAPAMEIRKILSVLPHRYPFLLVDRILSIEPGKRAVGLKNVSVNEEFFQGHFPGNPVMPGVLILESMAQIGGCLVFASDPSFKQRKLMYLSGIDKARFRRPVVPGDQLVVSVEVLTVRASFIKIRGEARVDGQLAAEAELLSSLVDLPEGMVG
ncbi:MAG TPA: 3-hydroxyacyl-ACP dehydratase FabZ [Thermoanaerobaculia bacterium]|nr:3-hydroxyacyl-ACP dehydratase FabZ [Thermoanaerobaculia bacterium]